MLKAEWFNINVDEHFNKYYPLVFKWWQDWKWQPIDPIMLPQNGIIIKDTESNEYICAGWLWVTDSAMCVIDLIISNRAYKNKELRKQGFIELIKTLEVMAKKLEFKAIFTTTKHDSLIKSFETLDYAKDGKKDENMTVFIKKI